MPPALIAVVLLVLNSVSRVGPELPASSQDAIA
jgi:hypothetical protein